jgi:ATP-dependent Lhr-like helicase
VVLAAADPANPYGAALPWPARTADGEADGSHRPGRKAGALVALVDGELAWFLERGGRSLLSFTDDADAQLAAAAALADLVGRGRVQSLLVEKVNGVAVLEPAQGGVRATVHDALTGAGFTRTPRGLRLR